jgi:outer membrane lipopolysaccharide assembly protein LptE/RlpB
MGTTWMRAAVAALLAAAALSIAGCGYHLAGSTIAGDRAATIHIPVFGNRTFRPVIDALMTNAVIREVSGRPGSWRIGGEDAEYLLSGTVLTCSSDPVAYSALDRVKEYRMAVSAEFTLQKMPGKTVVWKTVLTEAQDYPANPVVAFQQNSENAAVKELSARMARQISILLLENF